MAGTGAGDAFEQVIFAFLISPFSMRKRGDKRFMLIMAQR